MNQLTPNSEFTYVYQLGDPLDASTNYVQSVVRLSSDSTVVSTMNMLNVSGQRFAGSFRVPSDVAGTGYYLDITTTVYTDSSYTQRSQNYPIQTSQFLVLQPSTQSSIGGNSGGYSDDAELRKRLLRIEEAILGIKIPRQEKVDLGPVMRRIGGIVVPDPVDLSPIIKAIGDIEIPEIPEIEPVDLYPIIEGIHNISSSHDSLMKSLADMHASHERRVSDTIKKSHSDLMERIAETIESNSDESAKSRMKDVMSRMIDDPSFSSAKKEVKEEVRKIDPRVRRLVSPQFE